MSVLLDAVQFNHDPNSATGDALNLRKSASQFVTLPEWQHGISVNPEDSPAAYAIAETRGQTLTIQARFSRTEPTIATAEIRALDPTVDPPEEQGCGCLAPFVRLLRLILRALIGNVLGDVAARQVAFLPSGLSNFETFQLQNVRLWDVGVGIRTTTWRWQYRLQPGDPWTDFATSNHRIYVLLEVPKLPWAQQPYNAGNPQLPWTDVLDYACNWAVLTTSLDDAAARVTQSVYDLGPGLLAYDCPGGGSTNYAFGGFDCTAFLERLRGGFGRGQWVNCTDCATFVSTFANILGCDLWQSQMGWGFTLNPLRAIGSSVWQPACGWPTGFSYHEVAWKGNCTANEEVFDACLQVDGDADPTTAPHTPLLPTNLRFGNPGDGQYRDRLATPAGRPTCAPQPGTRTRRSVG
jgi:hypothetical protein